MAKEDHSSLLTPHSYSLPYGKGRLHFHVPDVAVDCLESRKVATVRNPPAALKRALANPIGAKPLATIARGKRSAAIVISDITRRVPNVLILSAILPVLEAAGIPRRAITIIIGTGTHRAATPTEVRTLVGARIAKAYNVVSHDCRRGNTRIGELANPLTGDTIPLEINRRYADADLKIVTGLVEPHIFCGYSGGRKAILPGIASLASIRRWHCPEIVAHPKSTPGTIRGNVAHALTARAARIAGCDFCVNVTLDKARNVTGIFAGNVTSVFAAAVKHVETYVLTQPVAPAEVIITSAAGWPLDLTLYQAIKGLVAILPIMKRRNSIVMLVAKCNEGYGDKGFSDLISRTKDVVAWSRNIKSDKHFQLGQWQWQRMGWTRQRGRVLLVSDLSDAAAKAAFTEPFPTLDAAVKYALQETCAKRIVVVPEGPYVVTRSRGR